MIIIKKADLINRKGHTLQLSNLKNLQVENVDNFKNEYYPILEKTYGKRVKEIVNKEEVTNWDLNLTYFEK